MFVPTQANTSTNSPAASSQAKPSTFFQPKLTVNTPGDTYEQEADHVANQVMRMKNSDAPFFSPSAQSQQGIQRKCDSCEHEEKVQRKETNDGVSGQTAPPLVSEVISSGGGQPLDADTKGFMESRMGQDFSQVRVHTGARAAESAAAIQAKAYTSGRDVVFGAGEYQPASESGKQLLAHELVHVGQQSTSNIQRKPSPEKSKINPEGYTIDEFISIVKKIEKSRPDWKPRQVLESLHNIAGTNNQRHRRVMQTEEGNSLINVIDLKDIVKLGGMLVHSNVEAPYETGVVKDNTNQNIALSHVLTGIGAGLSRRIISPSEIADGFLPAVGDLVTAGSNMDTLYSETLSGDLAQSAVQYNAGKQKSLVGPGTEATYAELVGDIDGFILGSQLSSTSLKEEFKKGEMKLSALLESYYTGQHNDRFNKISSFNTYTLKEETQNAADNLTYDEHGPVKGPFTEVGTEADMAVDKYSEWLESKKKPSIPLKKQSPPKEGTVTASGLHIRMLPNLTATISGMYFQGDVVKIIGSTLGADVEGNKIWHQTDRGFISSQYVRPTNSSNQINFAKTAPTKKIEEFTVTVKSFINPIGNDTGFIYCPSLLDPSSVTANINLRAFALVLDQIVKGDTPTDGAKDKKYRLFSSRKFTVYFTNNEITNVEASLIITDVGDEGPLKPKPLIIFNDVHSIEKPTKFGFAWAAKGRPSSWAEPTFQAICPRLSVYIWHSINASIELLGGRPAVTIINLLDSKFPSDKVYVNGVERVSHSQGKFKQLWNSHPSDPFMVE